MATTLDERRQKTNPRPAAAMDLASVDGAAPLNLTRPGTMKPDAPAPIPTQPAPQFTRTNAGPMLQQPATPAPAPASPSPASQQLANQAAMYVQGAQAAAAQRPANSAQQMVGTPSAGAQAANQQLERIKAMAQPGAAGVSAANAATAPRAAPMRQAPYTGANTMNQRAYAEAEARKTAANPTGSIYGMGRQVDAAPTAAQALTQPSQPLDAQAAADAKMFGRAWDATKDGFQRAGAAIADVATLPVRAAAGAYDTAVIRPMRAAGLNAGYMSPLVNPASNADGKSMTPFYDQFRARDEMAQTATDYGNEGRRAPMPAVPAAAVASAQGQRGTLEAQAKNPASDQGQVPGAAPPMPQGAQPEVGPPSGYTSTSVDGVYRKGNSFTDEAGTRAAPRTGTVSAQNNAAAEALTSGMGANQQALARMQAANAPAAPAAQQLVMPTVKTSANDWQARNDLRSLRVSANSLSNEPRWGGQGAKSPDVIAYEQALATDNALKQGKNPLAQELLQQQGGIARTTIQDQGETTRANTREQGANARAAMTDGIQRGELGLKQEAQGFASRAAQRLEAAQAAYDNAKTDEERAAAAKRIRAIQGKGEDVAAKDRYITTGGGQEFDVDAKSIVTRPQRIYDTQTRQYVDGAPSQPAAAPDAKDRPVGTVSEVNGKRAVWDGKKWVAQ